MLLEPTSISSNSSCQIDKFSPFSVSSPSTSTEFYLSIYLSIYGIYIAPLQGNYSEVLPARPGLGRASSCSLSSKNISDLVFSSCFCSVKNLCIFMNAFYVTWPLIRSRSVNTVNSVRFSSIAIPVPLPWVLSITFSASLHYIWCTWPIFGSPHIQLNLIFPFLFKWKM